MKAGFLCAVCSALAAFIWVAVATSGLDDAASARDAKMLAALAAALAVIGGVMIAAWWRLAGRPRHH